MPEYLAPGVYIEETSFRSRSIEGVSTSTAGFIGPARFGPISGEPELLTSLADFERIYGSQDDLSFTEGMQTNYLAHAVQNFFDEGGKRLYVTRVFHFGAGDSTGPLDWTHYAGTPGMFASPVSGLLELRARFPGAQGNLRVTFTLRVSTNAFNAAGPGGAGPSLTRVHDYDVVHVRNNNSPVFGDGLAVARWDPMNSRWRLHHNGTDVLLAALPTTAQVRVLTVVVEVAFPANSATGFGPPVSFGEFGFDGRSPAGLTQTFTRNPSTRQAALTTPFALEVPNELGADDELPPALLSELLGPECLATLLNDTLPVSQRQVMYTLHGGDDGALPTAEDFTGRDASTFTDYEYDSTANPLQRVKNGLLAFEAVEDISMVAAPGFGGNVGTGQAQADEQVAIQAAIINHCETMRYRVAILDTPPHQLVSGALDYRNKRSSDYAALYYPWITVLDPLTANRLDLPPSGFVAGIWARNDIEHAVFKAPANEVVRTAIDFEFRLNKAQQEVLNPDGVNCFRYFDRLGFLLWGARTISDNSDWKYVSLRRYFAYLEHSIDRGTQWVVFENNGPQLWDNVRHTVEDFLLNEWKSGGLIGAKPELAYFVRCDRSTMTQNDLDNGRLICLIGVAPVRPAEFVIFRIGQWTANSQQ